MQCFIFFFEDVTIFTVTCTTIFDTAAVVNHLYMHIFKAFTFVE